VNEMSDARGNSDLSGAEAVAEVLIMSGVRYAFAYPGTSELALCDAIERYDSLSLINGRGDRESAFMAVGASLLEPNRGVAILHGARGLTNAAGALGDARRNEVGTMLLVGLPSTTSAAYLPPHGEPVLIDTLANLAAWAWEAPAVPQEPAARAAAADELIRALREGLLASARPPRGPALFGLPQDVAEQRWIPRSSLVGSSQRLAEPASPDASAVVDVIRAAHRPLFLVDDYALRYEGLRGVLDDLSQRTGGPVLQVRYRRGPMLFERLHSVDVRNFVGWLDPTSSAHQTLLQQCDVLVTIEDRNMYPRVVGQLPNCRKVAVTSDSRKVHKNAYLSSGDVLVEGDPVEVLRAVTIALGRSRAVPRWFRADAPKECRSTAEKLSPTLPQRRAALCRALGRVLAGWENGVLVDDSQMFGGLLSEHYEELPLGLRVFGDHGGFVGAGIAQATGLTLANKGVRVMCTLGDEGFANGFQGLVAAVQEVARVLLVVCNNGGAVSLQKQAAADLGTAERSYLANADCVRYHALAAAIGVPAERVEVPILSARQDFDAAMARVAEVLAEADAVDDGPSMVELVLPPEQEAWQGIWLLEGFEQLAIDRRTP
jgi:acetolactate synthase-1/2/3 large subunit